ncbi:MAG: hypothetical protein E7011_00960 [Alphaproteobacteria bacterium]|nr:hypothetical protein [Alphaproteobacteria bacterium]
MKIFKHIFAMLICAMPFVASAQVATTAGNNLTAWNGNSGATNNNNWNQMMNSRTMAVQNAPTADFGNCNSLILRCAQPKCSGCSTIDIARPIVAGCVNSNDACKKYGNDLIEYISAQLVSNANAKAQQQQLAAQQAASVAAQQQSAMQMQQMQQQMAQMQQQMQQQNEQQIAQMQAALDEQKQLTAAAMQEVAAQQQQMQQVSTPSGNGALTDAQVAAAQAGVSADVLAREQIAGQIMSKIESAEVALKTLNATMQNAFVYAGCDTRGNNCSGPKRVKTFKQKAMAFFEPYDAIVDEAYEGLEMALAVGVDVSDVIMMLSGACNQWGKFLCVGEGTEHKPTKYDDKNCQNGRSIKVGYVKGGMECTPNMAVPPQDDARCTLTSLIGSDGDNEDVYREWLDENYEGDRLVRVGCATSALDSISIFGRRNSKRGTSLDLDTLERILLQDSPEYIGNNRYMRGSADPFTERMKYCALTPNGYQILLNAVHSKKLPKKICVDNNTLTNNFKFGGPVAANAFGGTGLDSSIVSSAYDNRTCDSWKTLAPQGCGTEWDGKNARCVVTGDCKFTGEAIVTTAVLTKFNADNAKKVADLTAAAKCTGAGIWVKSGPGMFGGTVCYCGDMVINIDKQECEKDYQTNKLIIKDK